MSANSNDTQSLWSNLGLAMTSQAEPIAPRRRQSRVAPQAEVPAESKDAIDHLANDIAAQPLAV